MKRIVLCILLMLPLLVSCAAKPPNTILVPQTEVIYLTPPPELLQCMDVPEFPPLPLDDNDVAAFMLELWAAHRDCKMAVEHTRQWVEGAGK